MVELKDIEQCPACGSSNIIYDEKRDEIACQDCSEMFAELTQEMEKKYEEASDVI